MIILLKFFGLTIASIFIGILIYYLWFGIFWFIYEKLYGPYPLTEVFFLTIYIKKPFYYAIFPALLFGIIQGFLTALLCGFFDLSNILYAGIIGLFVILFGVFSVFALLSLIDEPNPIGFIFQFAMSVIYEFATVVRVILFFLFPSFLSGFLISRIKILIFN